MDLKEDFGGHRLVGFWALTPKNCFGDLVSAPNVTLVFDTVRGTHSDVLAGEEIKFIIYQPIRK